MTQNTPSEAPGGASERLVDPGWYLASLRELSAFLEAVGENGEVSVKPGDDVVAAILGVMEGVSVVVRAGEHATMSAALLDSLGR